MHVKDIRKGAPTGIYTGHAPATDDVAVGTGPGRLALGPQGGPGGGR
jgi:hypothetical protein